MTAPSPISAAPNAGLPAPGSSPDENFGLLLRNVREGLMRRFQKDLTACAVELNPTQFMVLKHLALQGTTTSSELAKALSHDAGAMTRMVDCLERNGYAQRVASTEDRRVVHISLTPTGQAAWKRMSVKLTEVLGQALGVLSADEKNQLIDLLSRVQATIDALPE